MSKNIVALQTARAGSKSIPKKNLLEVDGHPLFAHSTRAAVGCELINSVWCSTDDAVIKSYSDKQTTRTAQEVYIMLMVTFGLCGVTLYFVKIITYRFSG